ncbi:hypothetical protein CJF42_17850 [Pseudoalteromonas sp. NBT06-2]|uniref:hypothetical protein n=1 Tax=Pseudoalteromonas sp. NBT06-2 TaxID=2025950 RepID=UPI000BA7AECF|nr:hypothetical protein [Pseudoalteromonas sp. NBT06-2]PAJ73072.1 hypothetical protein CJF42_17850 [Pseudoalteromonas sp. NBT06-2]
MSLDNFREILNLIYSSYLLFLGGAAILLYFFSDKPSYRFALVTFCFFLIGVLFSDLVKEFDYKVYIARYIFWASIDLFWMGTIAYLTMKDKIHLWQSILGQLIVLPAPLLQLVRLVDRHYFDLSYTDYLYVTLLPIINTAVVALCFAPLIVIFTQYLKNKNTKEAVDA